MLSFGIEAASGHQNMSVILSIMENSRQLKRHCIEFVKDAVHVFQCFARLRCDEPMASTLFDDFFLFRNGAAACGLR